jgi:zinc transport system substrate-binding protein
MMAATEAELWFGISEPFEVKVYNTLKSYKPGLQWVDLRKNLDLIHESACSHGGCIDPHIWLSPTLAKEQVNTILETLREKFPENREIYEKNAAALKRQLDELNREMTFL